MRHHSVGSATHLALHVQRRGRGEAGQPQHVPSGGRAPSRPRTLPEWRQNVAFARARRLRRHVGVNASANAIPAAASARGRRPAARERESATPGLGFETAEASQSWCEKKFIVLAEVEGSLISLALEIAMANRLSIIRPTAIAKSVAG